MGTKVCNRTRKSKIDYKVRSQVVNNGRSEIFLLPEVGTSSGQEEVSSSCGHRLLTLELDTGRGLTGGGQEECSRWTHEWMPEVGDGGTRGGHQWYTSVQMWAPE
jgi:hypothetical protein